MRIFLVCLLSCLSAIECNAANPSFSSFDQTYFTTNNRVISFNAAAVAALGSTNLWTNDLARLRPIPTITYSYLYPSNLYSQGWRGIEPAYKLLTTGTNTIPSRTNSTIILLSDDTDPANVIVQLQAGFNGQELHLLSYSNATYTGQFTLPADSAVSGSSGFVKLANNTDWVAANGSLLWLQFNNPDWVEISRNVIGTNTVGVVDQYWTNSAGILQPIAGTSVSVTNLSSYRTLTAEGSLKISSDSKPTLSTGTNILATDYLSYIPVTGANGTATDSYLAFASTNLFGQLLIIENYGNAFCLTNGTPIWNDPSASVILPNGDWCPTTLGESIWLFGDNQGNWIEVERVDPAAPSSTTINPTDGYTPYRIDANTFGDSPWYRIDDNTLGLSSTTRFLYGSSGGNAVAIGLLSGIGATHSFNAGFAAGRDATGQGIVNIGSAAGQQSDGNFHVFIGNAAGKFAEGEGDVGIGLQSLYQNTNGLYNIAIGSYSGQGEQGSYNTFVGTESFGASGISTNDYNVAIGYRAGYTTTGVTNTIAIGHNVSATNDNEIIIGAPESDVVVFPMLQIFANTQRAKILSDDTLDLEAGSAFDIRFWTDGVEQWEVDPNGDFISLRAGLNNIGVDQSGLLNAPGTIAANNFLVIANAHTPASSSETNFLGAITWDANYLYIWTALNVNKRIALTTW